MIGLVAEYPLVTGLVVAHARRDGVPCRRSPMLTHRNPAAVDLVHPPRVEERSVVPQADAPADVVPPAVRRSAPVCVAA
jgi:hypothetical protein